MLALLNERILFRGFCCFLRPLTKWGAAGETAARLKGRELGAGMGAPDCIWRRGRYAAVRVELSKSLIDAEALRRLQTGAPWGWELGWDERFFVGWFRAVFRWNYWFYWGFVGLARFRELGCASQLDQLEMRFEVELAGVPGRRRRRVRGVWLDGRGWLGRRWGCLRSF